MRLVGVDTPEVPTTRLTPSADDSGRAASPPQGGCPATHSEFDDSRDYFPVARQPVATRPPADAPTMVEAVALICGAKAHSCICGLPVDHAGAHECQRDGGQWIGTIGCDDFEPVRFPDPFWQQQEATS